jgi:putative aminopeptidase FrvX
MASLRETLLHETLSLPTAPFREGHVIRFLTKQLEAAKVPYFQDPIGNIVIGVASKAEYLAAVRKKTPEPLRIYIAHMDHPGFHGIRWKNDSELEVKWHGGSPVEQVIESKVWVGSSAGQIGEGHFTDIVQHPSGRAIGAGTLRFSGTTLAAAKAITPDKLYGGFNFRAPVWREGDLLYTRVADDLVGCFAIVSIALDLLSGKKKHSPNFIGLLTRAEEVGFIGAIGHFELGWHLDAKRPLMGVSLETSRTLPGAEIGKGPVVRLGDKSTVFHSGYIHVFEGLAREFLPGRHQRRVMDGGSCEATAATAYGIPCVGISVPLGNYHNQSFQGGPDSRHPDGPSPEFVHLDDINGLLDLCLALLKPKLPWADPFAEKLKTLKRNFRDLKPLLKSGP